MTIVRQLSYDTMDYIMHFKLVVFIDEVLCGFPYWTNYPE